MDPAMTDNNDDGFYIFLPSNVISGDPSNPSTLSAYRTRLNKPLSLENGLWEVGLVEATYPVRIRTFTKDVYVSLVLIGKQEGRAPQTLPEDKLFKDGAPSRMLAVKAGYHDDLEALLTEISKAITKLFEECILKQLKICPSMSYDSVNGKVTISYTVMNWRPTVLTAVIPSFPENPEVEAMLGFMQKDIQNVILDDFALMQKTGKEETKERSVSAEEEADIRHGTNLLFVYTDITQPVQVGDAAAPLLRTLPVASPTASNKSSGRAIFGQSMVTEAFIRPYYFPLQKTYISEIYVYISDENGRQIKFGKPGRVQLVLHFRRALHR